MFKHRNNHQRIVQLLKVYKGIVHQRLLPNIFFSFKKSLACLTNGGCWVITDKSANGHQKISLHGLAADTPLSGNSMEGILEEKPRKNSIWMSLSVVSCFFQHIWTSFYIDIYIYLHCVGFGYRDELFQTELKPLGVVHFFNNTFLMCCWSYASRSRNRLIHSRNACEKILI